MKDFVQRNKVFIIVIVATCILVVGGIFLMTKGGSTSDLSSTTVSSSILIPPGAYETSGYANGIYLPANPSAKLTLVEFGDFECPACALYEPVVKQVLTSFPGQVIYVFRNFPLSQHKNALISSYALEAAGLQGKYWEMYDKLYSTQNDWANSSDPTPILIGYAKDMGLNTDLFTTDLNSQKVKDIVKKDESDGATVGISQTPTFYVNGKKVNLTGDPNQLKSLIQTELAK